MIVYFNLRRLSKDPSPAIRKEMINFDSDRYLEVTKLNLGVV